ncbi:MAG: hypothetical protein AB7P23_01820 [Amphiplicatus sp.]
MVNLTKRRVDVSAGKNGVWFEDIPDWRGIAVKTTALDTDECIKVREDILEFMFGDPNHEVRENWLRDYINARVLLDGAIKDIRGLTDDLGKEISYSRAYLAMIVLRPQDPANTPATPDGMEYDEAAKQIVNMLLARGIAAGKVLEGAEKKLSPAGFAGAAASSSASETLTKATMTKTASPSGSDAANEKKARH